MRTDELESLPDDLPVPIDDGATDHLAGMAVPPLAHAGDRWVVRPPGPARIRRARLEPWSSPTRGPADPDEDPPGGLVAWDAIPGARGCTPQACAYRDRHAALTAAGARVFGLSTQDSDYQREMVDRLHLPFPVLSDAFLRPDRRPAVADLRDGRPAAAQAATPSSSATGASSTSSIRSSRRIRTPIRSSPG